MYDRQTVAVQHAAMNINKKCRGENEEGICELIAQESGKVSYAIQTFGNEVINGILLLLKKMICSGKRRLGDSPGFSVISSLVLNKAVNAAGSQSPSLQSEMG